MRGEQETNCLTRVKQNLDRNSVHYFCSDPQKIIRILKSARPNPAQSNFPDFLFENGFIVSFMRFSLLFALPPVKDGAQLISKKCLFFNRFSYFCAC